MKMMKVSFDTLAGTAVSILIIIAAAMILYAMTLRTLQLEAKHPEWSVKI